MLRLSLAGPPRIVLADGTIEALKTLALVLMTLDHTNKFLLADGMPGLSLAGRLAFPLFAFILGFNLARPGLDLSGAGSRVLKRLFLFGCIATIPYVYLLNMQWWQLNVLFTLWAGAAIVVLIARQNPLYNILAGALFIGAGFLVDYFWAGIALCVASWLFCRKPSWTTFLMWFVSLASLFFINGNFAALLTLPVLMYATNLELSFRRLRNFFYWFYPLHLFAIGLLALWSRP